MTEETIDKVVTENSCPYTLGCNIPKRKSVCSNYESCFNYKALRIMNIANTEIQY